MSIQERIAKTEENFNQLKEAYNEKEQTVQKLQNEMIELEKQLIFTRGVYQALVEVNEDAEAVTEDAAVTVVE